MYATAQRVVSPDGAHGVQVYRYSHAHVESPVIDWSSPDVAYIADNAPGTLVLAARQVAAQRNRVISFLDVVAPEELPLTAVSALLIANPPQLTNGRDETWAAGAARFRFHLSPMSSAEPRTEWQSLAQHLLGALRLSAVAPVTQADHSTSFVGPVRIVVQRSAAGCRYELEPDSRRRLAMGVSAARPAPVSVNIADDVREDFRSQHGRTPWREIVGLLSNLSPDQVAALGIIEFVDHATGAVVHRASGAEL